MTDKTNTKNIYARGADNGLWLGLLFLAIFGCAAGSLTIGALNIAVMGLAVTVPFVAHYGMGRTVVVSRGLVAYSGLGMQGIVAFACGSLILGMGSFIYMRFVNAGFITEVLNYGIDFYKSTGTPGGREMAADLTSVIENNLVPRPQDVVLMWMWGAIFSGSLLSMLLALVARARRVPVNK